MVNENKLVKVFNPFSESEYDIDTFDISFDGEFLCLEETIINPLLVTSIYYDLHVDYKGRLYRYDNSEERVLHFLEVKRE